jgi:hypothetical protein
VECHKPPLRGRFKYLNVLHVINVIMFGGGRMVSITLSVPEDLKREMDSFPEMKWSAVAREAIKNRVLLMQRFKELTKNSTLTEEDAIRLGRMVNASAARRHKFG